MLYFILIFFVSIVLQFMNSILGIAKFYESKTFISQFTMDTILFCGLTIAINLIIKTVCFTYYNLINKTKSEYHYNKFSEEIKITRRNIIIIGLLLKFAFDVSFDLNYYFKYANILQIIVYEVLTYTGVTFLGGCVYLLLIKYFHPLFFKQIIKQIHLDS